MTKRRRQLQYSSRPRRTRLAETRFGPIAALLLAILLLALTAFVLLYFVLPAVRTRPVATSVEEAAALSEAEAELPEDGLPGSVTGTSAGTVALFDVADAEWLLDPSVSGDSILFAAGMEEDALDRLVRYDTVTGEAEGILVPMRYDTLRNPVEDDARIVYVDAKAEGGGAIRAFDKATGETELVCELACDIPVLYYETPYLVWRERSPDGAVRLYACHLGTFDAVTLAVFDTPGAAQSLPYLAAGEAVYAEADPANPAYGAIRGVHLADGTIFDYAPGMFVHDPKRTGNLLTWTSGLHGTDNDLYCMADGGTIQKIAPGVIDYALTERAAVYSKDLTVYAYTFETGETVPLSKENEPALLAAADGSVIVWRSAASAVFPVYKYVRID